jgi:hypothetical protein
MRWATGAGMVIVAITSIVLARSEYLFKTRQALNLKSPISMAPGRVSTGEFGVDESDPYRIAIEFKKPTAIPSDTLDCLVGMAQWEPQVKCGSTHSVVNVKWTLYSGGSVLKSASSEGGNGYWAVGPSVAIGGFRGEAGHRYVLDVYIISDGSQLAPAEPQLAIMPASLEYYEDQDMARFLIRLGAGTCILLGLFLILFSLARNARQN